MNRPSADPLGAPAWRLPARDAVEIAAAALLWWLSAAGYLLVRHGLPGADSPANLAAQAACAAAVPGVAELRAEWQLVLIAASLALACGALAWRARTLLARVWLAWAAWEAAQVAVCSAGAWGLIVPAGTGLCLVRYGYGPALVLVAVSVLAVLVQLNRGSLWPRRNR